MRILQQRLAYAAAIASIAGCTLLTNLDDLTGPAVSLLEAGAPDADTIPVDADAGIDAPAVRPTCDAGTVDPQYLNDAVDVSVGDGFSCAVRATGAVVCWGSNLTATLGSVPQSGDPIFSARPVVVGGVPKATRVVTGFSHACAIDVDKHLWCWGNGPSLGSGDFFDAGAAYSTARMVTDDSEIPLVGVTAVGLGRSHTCAIVEGGSVSCWGANHFGQLGPLVTENYRNHAVLVPNLGGAKAVASGEYHVCVLREASQRQVDCWGWGFYGQLGTAPEPDGGNNWHSSLPFTMPLKNAGAGLPLGVSSGHQSTLIVDDNYNLYATGRNNRGEAGGLFLGKQLNAPSAVQGLADGMTLSTASGAEHTCAVRADGTAACIGRNDFGELGRGTQTSAELVPKPVVALGWSATKDTGTLRDVAQVGVGGLSAIAFGCALVKPACASAGSVVCWGSNGGGELGTGAISEFQPPVRVVAPL